MNEQNNDKYREYKEQIIQMFGYLPSDERSDMISRLVARYPIPTSFFKVKANLTKEEKEELIKRLNNKLASHDDVEYIPLVPPEINADRDQLEQALLAVMNCNTIEESIEEFRRHIGVTTYSDEKNRNLLAFGSIGHNARATDYIFPNDETLLEFDLIMQDLKKVFDKMYPGWETLNMELKGSARKLYCDSCGDLITSGKILHWVDGDFIFCDDDLRYKAPEQLKHYTLIKDGKIVQEKN